ncbi:hypothetical protein B0E47_12780 [Rhodanobacter sp. B05]|nr:hypothetical protein B0E47_12780 [Rhodanobacter sp. B05]
MEKGLTMKDSKVGLDTASLISKVRHVSVRSVELAWEKWRDTIDMWLAFQASESKELSAEKS